MITLAINKIGAKSISPSRETVFGQNDIRLVRASTEGAVLYVRQPADPSYKTYVSDEVFTAVETLLTGQHQRVTLTKVGATKLPKNRPALLWKEFIDNVISDGEGGSFIYYFLNDTIPTKLQVLESPAAIVAGNSSSTGSGL